MWQVHLERAILLLILPLSCLTKPTNRHARQISDFNVELPSQFPRLNPTEIRNPAQFPESQSQFFSLAPSQSDQQLIKNYITNIKQQHENLLTRQQNLQPLLQQLISQSENSPQPIIDQSHVIERPQVVPTNGHQPTTQAFLNNGQISADEMGSHPNVDSVVESLQYLHEIQALISNQQKQQEDIQKMIASQSQLQAQNEKIINSNTASKTTTPSPASSIQASILYLQYLQEQVKLQQQVVQLQSLMREAESIIKAQPAISPFTDITPVQHRFSGPVNTSPQITQMLSSVKINPLHSLSNFRAVNHLGQFNQHQINSLENRLHLFPSDNQRIPLRFHNQPRIIIEKVPVIVEISDKRKNASNSDFDFMFSVEPAVSASGVPVDNFDVEVTKVKNVPLSSDVIDFIENGEIKRRPSITKVVIPSKGESTAISSIEKQNITLNLKKTTEALNTLTGEKMKDELRDSISKSIMTSLSDNKTHELPVPAALSIVLAAGPPNVDSLIDIQADEMPQLSSSNLPNELMKNLSISTSNDHIDVSGFLVKLEAAPQENNEIQQDLIFVPEKAIMEISQEPLIMKAMMSASKISNLRVNSDVALNNTVNVGNFNNVLEENFAIDTISHVISKSTIDKNDQLLQEQADEMNNFKSKTIILDPEINIETTIEKNSQIPSNISENGNIVEKTLKSLVDETESQLNPKEMFKIKLNNDINKVNENISLFNSTEGFANTEFKVETTTTNLLELFGFSVFAKNESANDSLTVSENNGAFVDTLDEINTTVKNVIERDNVINIEQNLETENKTVDISEIDKLPGNSNGVLFKKRDNSSVNTKFEIITDENNNFLMVPVEKQETNNQGKQLVPGISEKIDGISNNNIGSSNKEPRVIVSVTKSVSVSSSPAKAQKLIKQNAFEKNQLDINKNNNKNLDLEKPNNALLIARLQHALNHPRTSTPLDSNAKSDSRSLRKESMDLIHNTDDQFFRNNSALQSEGHGDSSQATGTNNMLRPNNASISEIQTHIQKGMHKKEGKPSGLNNNRIFQTVEFKISPKEVKNGQIFQLNIPIEKITESFTTETTPIRIPVMPKPRPFIVTSSKDNPVITTISGSKIIDIELNNTQDNNANKVDHSIKNVTIQSSKDILMDFSKPNNQSEHSMSNIHDKENGRIGKDMNSSSNSENAIRNNNNETVKQAFHEPLLVVTQNKHDLVLLSDIIAKFTTIGDLSLLENLEKKSQQIESNIQQLVKNTTDIMKKITNSTIMKNELNLDPKIHSVSEASKIQSEIIDSTKIAGGQHTEQFQKAVSPMGDFIMKSTAPHDDLSFGIPLFIS